MDEEKAKDDDEGDTGKPPPYNPLGGSAHGAIFHLTQLAYFQLQHRYAQGLAVKGIEKKRYVWFFKDVVDEFEPDPTKVKTYRRLYRKVDIVLDKGTEGEQWVELKSFEAKSEAERHRLKAHNEPVEQWDFALRSKKGKKSRYNRQFIADRAAAHVGIARMGRPESKLFGFTHKGFEPIIVSPDFKWRFQKFNIKDKRDTTTTMVSPDLGTVNNPNSIRYRISQNPAFGSGPTNTNLTVKNIFTLNAGDYSSTLGGHIDYADVKQMLLDLSAKGFQVAQDALDAELDTSGI